MSATTPAVGAMRRGSRAPRTLRRLAVAALGMTVLTGCGGSVYDLPLPGGAKVGDDPMTVHVRFRDVLDLVPKSTVRINDVTVGKISAVDLKGYTADVTIELPKNTKLPDNTRAEIRQTSLLGEKFVSLSPPDDPEGKLANGDVIPLSRTGRNPEVEEVLGALSLILNGGGVGQLRTIAGELNDALGGREDQVRDVLEQLKTFTGQLDQDKDKIVAAIESLNRLAIAAKRQDSTIKLTLDELPSAIASINSQRADLVKTLTALDRLSDVGVRVIRETKANTISTINDLGPVLDKLADAGSAFPRSIQVQLTFPFVDETVGRNPLVARNLHFGDYVNLNANLNINSDFLSNGCKLLIGTVSSALKQAGLTGNALGAAVTQVLSQFTQDNGGCDQFTGLTQSGLTQLTSILKGLGLNTDVVGSAITNLTAALTNPLTLPTTAQAQRQSTATSTQQSLQGLTQRRSNGGGLLGGVLGGTTTTKRSTTTTTTPSTSGSSGGSSGSIFNDLLGMGRAATGYDLRDGNGKRGDALDGPAGTSAQLGYNSTLGALLLQGVSSS